MDGTQIQRGGADPLAYGTFSEAAEQERLNSLELRFDGDGRYPLDYRGVCFAARSTGSCEDSGGSTSAIVTPEVAAAALAECERLFAASAEVDSSFWVPADAAPVSLLERLALAVFQAHTAGLIPAAIDPGNSGAEWWYVVREPSGSSGEASSCEVSSSGGAGDGDDDDAHGGGEDGIDFHWDKVA